MQLTADVNVPNELVQAARERRLVLFVGAGASVNSPSDLPLFNGLAEQIARSLGEEYVESINPDAFLGELMDRHGSVKEQVKAITGSRNSRPNATHRALARLANATGCRVVSTNYDEHIETAARDEGLDLRGRFLAPALPLGRTFDGVVYLHGAASGDAADLVVTDGDFGRAYLTDGWARRFAHELFLHWTVLFVGYSHSDVVMTYLARGLPNGAQRFVMTDKPDDRRWRTLGVTPVFYPGADEHSALSTALDAWAALMRMGRLDHHARVKEIAGGTPPKAPEEVDYLTDAVATPAGALGFASAARGSDWLRWAENQPPFEALFKPGPCHDEAALVLANWFVENYVADVSMSPLALETIARMGPVVCDQLLWSITRVLKELSRNSPEEAKRWAAVAGAALRTTAAEAPGTGYQPYSDPLTGGDLLPALRRALMPRLVVSERRPLFSFDEEGRDLPSGVTAEIEWPISEGLLNVLWERLSIALDAVAFDVVEVVGQALLHAYQLLHAFEIDRSFDAWSFRRSAIEPHPQDQFQEDMDVIIDALRDSGNLVVRHNESLTLRWITSDFTVFRRLGVHLLIECSLSPEEKIAVFLSSNVLYDHDCKHEVFRFLAVVGSVLPAEIRPSVLASITSGPPADDPIGSAGSRLRNRVIFDRLEWLQRHALSWSELDNAVEQIRELEPEMGVRDHPDFDHWMESGTWGGRQPLTSDEFAEAITEKGPWSAIGLLTGRDYSDHDFNEPTWEDVCQLVRETSAAKPSLGLSLLPSLEITPLAKYHDLVAASLYGLADSGAGHPNLPVVLDAVTPLANRPELTRALSELVRKAVRWSERATDEAMARVDELAIDLWSLHAAGFDGSGWSDALMRGLNTWPGFLAQYWLQRISNRWQADRQTWSGLSSAESSAIRLMLDTEQSAAASATATSILAGDIRFLFAADGSFALEYVVPLFDESTSPLSADAWFSFLHNPRTSPELLDAGFWDLILRSLSTIATFPDHTVQRQYWRLLSSIAAFSTARSVDRSALIAFLANPPDGSHLVSFLDALGEVVGDLDKTGMLELWNRWLGAEMTARVASAPGVQSAAERAAWGDFALESALPEALQLSNSAPGPMTGRTRFHDLAPAFAYENADLLLTVALGRLSLNAQADWHIQYELSELVLRVRDRADPALLRALAEMALTLGISEAVGWGV